MKNNEKMRGDKQGMTNVCAICGAQINLVQRVKLIDGNYICLKKCKNMGMPDLNYTHASLETVLAHNRQVSEGTKLFTQYFLKEGSMGRLQKNVVTKGKNLYIREDMELIALAYSDYKTFYFGKQFLKACVYSMDNLERCEPDISRICVNGQERIKKGLRYSFRNVEGLSEFFVEDNKRKSTKEYFDKLIATRKSDKNKKIS